MVVTKQPMLHRDQYGFLNGGNEIIQSGELAGKTLQGVAMNSLAGLLLQLTTLSNVANEIFNELLTSSKETHQRIVTLGSKVRTIQNALPQNEQYLYQHNSQLLYTSVGSQWKSSAKQDQMVIKRENLPEALSKQYNKCAALPSLDHLDRYQENNNKCISHISDPAYFFRAWVEVELARQEKERQERKAERQARIEEAKKAGTYISKKDRKTADADKKKVPPVMIKRKQYSAMGAEFADGPSPISAGTPATVPAVKVTPSPVGQQPTAWSAPAAAPPPAAALSAGIPPPPPPPSGSFARAPSAIPSSFAAAPPPPPPPPPSGGMAFAAAPPPPPPPPSGGMAFAAAPPPPPPPPPGIGASPAAAIPRPHGGGGSSAPPAPKPMSLLEQIRGGKQLRSAADRTLPEPKPKQEEESFDVAAILKRKFMAVLEDDDDDADEDDDDGEW